MTIIEGVDYGPLAKLIGTWKGDEGMDISPKKAGIEENPYFETITFEAGGDVTNAEEQVLAIVPYTQIVSRKSNNSVFHHQIGYWLWDAKARVVMQNFAIPRAVALVAGGEFTGDENTEAFNIKVSANCDDSGFGIAQSPFMRDNAKTVSFTQTLSIKGDTLHYAQSTILDIYGKTFDHTDESTLKKA